MIENIPNSVDSAFLYFHTRRSSGDEMASFVEEMRRELRFQPGAVLFKAAGVVAECHEYPDAAHGFPR
jgi:hypothetical protein